MTKEPYAEWISKEDGGFMLSGFGTLPKVERNKLTLQSDSWRFEKHPFSWYQWMLVFGGHDEPTLSLVQGRPDQKYLDSLPEKEGGLKTLFPIYLPRQWERVQPDRVASVELTTANAFFGNKPSQFTITRPVDDDMFDGFINTSGLKPPFVFDDDGVELLFLFMDDGTRHVITTCWHKKDDMLRYQAAVRRQIEWAKTRLAGKTPAAGESGDFYL